ncbi:MAG: diguanylate cyclase, partial [Erythrobacter sp.]|uniref:CHASE sensor domain-containing protein n=1 Tax=Erythrobacter sp. TaxID=1042 RepID=UPI0025EFC9F3
MIGQAGNGERPPTLRGVLARGHLRLVLLAVLLASLSLMASGLFALRGYAGQNVALAAETLSYAVEPPLVFGDREAAERVVFRLAANDNLASIEVYNAAGQPFVVWRRAGSSSVDLGPFVSRWLGLGPVSRRIDFQNETVGEVRVTGTISAIFSYTLASLIIAVSSLGITVLATRILARRLEEAIAAPLDRVAEIAHEVIIQRRPSLRLAPAGIAELDQITADFNMLLDELEKWHESISTENAELSRRADRDPLTGLGNRAWLERDLEAAIAEARLMRGQVVLLYCDCNGFKQVNDTHGHDAGDKIIACVAERLRRAVADPDRVFRLG